MTTQGQTDGSEPAFEFNPDDLGFSRDPYTTYAYLRRNGPYYWAKHDAWIFSRYDDVGTILRDPRFSLDARDWEHAPPPLAGEPSEFDRLFQYGLRSVPPHDHIRLRRLINPAFTPRAVERMRADVQEIADDALARNVLVDGHFDLTQMADEIPLRAISTILRIPKEHDPVFRAFGSALVYFINPRLSAEERARVLEPFPAGAALLRELIEQRRSAPGPDLLSTLIQAEEAGSRLSHDELISLVMALISAGSETTVHLICFAAYNLLRHPAELALVRADPTLMRGALDEVLRYDSFGKTSIARFATVEMEIGGVKLRKGQMVCPLLAAALRDEAVFPDPDRFDIRRDRLANISFGTGPHNCIGAALARLEGEVVVGTLLDRFPRLALAGEPTFSPHPFLRKMSSLPLRVE